MAGIGDAVKDDTMAEKLKNVFMAYSSKYPSDARVESDPKGHEELRMHGLKYDESQAGKSLGWYLLRTHLGGVGAVAETLGSKIPAGDENPGGLDPDKVDSNRKYGVNELPQKQYDGMLTIFINSFKDPTLILLIIVALIQIVIWVIIKTIDFTGCQTTEQMDCKARIEDVQAAFKGKTYWDAVVTRHNKPETELEKFYNMYFGAFTDDETTRVGCEGNAECAKLLESSRWNQEKVQGDLQSDILIGYGARGREVFSAMQKNCSGLPFAVSGDQESWKTSKDSCIDSLMRRVTNPAQGSAWHKVALHYQYTTVKGTACSLMAVEDDCDEDGLCPAKSEDDTHEEPVPLDAIAILATVLLVSCVATVQDYNSQQSFRKLDEQTERGKKCQVWRKGELKDVPIHDVVVGDILYLKSGEKVCADGFCVTSNGLQIVEADMTGEPDPIPKIAWSDEKGLGPKRWEDSWIFCGTEVQLGNGTMLVTCVGPRTLFGQMMEKVTEDGSEETPLQAKLAVMAELIGQGGTMAAVLTFVGLLLIFVIGDIAIEKKSCEVAAVFSEIVNYLIVAVTVVVVAVPEGLPLAVTIALSASMGKMKDQHVLVKKLKACETMGGATNVCTDKTGTLTENKMSLIAGWFAGKQVEAQQGQEASATTVSISLKGDLNGMIETIIEGFACNTETSSEVTEDNNKQLIFKGNPTECALLRLCDLLGADKPWYKDGKGYEGQRAKFRVSDGRQTPFSSQRKRMSTIIGRSTCVTTDGQIAKDTIPEAQRGPVLWVKGAAEIVLKLGTNYVDQDGTVKPLDAVKMKGIEDFMKKMQATGLRAICVGYRAMPDGNTEVEGKEFGEKPDGAGWRTRKSENQAEFVLRPEQLEHSLTIVALVGIKDPLRKDVDKSVEKLTRAGVKVRMVTGDNKDTAQQIAKDCNILDKTKNYTPDELSKLVIEGPDFRKLSTSEMKDLLQSGLRVMARSSPLDKEKLVNCLIEMGEVVAVTGDGTNDAPALHTADVGMAMGIAGTEVAKAAADIVLLDDSFNSIVTACKWGRNVYDSVRKFLQFQLTVNVVACTLVFIAAITRQGMPLNAVQLLWVNLIMDSFGALALATENPNEDELLNRAPDGRNDPLISRKMWRNILVQSAFQLIILLVMLYSGASFLPADLSQQSDSNRGQQVHCLNMCWEHKAILRGCETHIDNARRSYFYGRNDAKPTERTMCPAEITELKDVMIEDLEKSRKTLILNTMIFNTFVFCQVFNEFNARRIDKLNIFEGIHRHWQFLVIFLITVGLQVVMVEVLTKFVNTDHLGGDQWLICIGIGALSICPVGVIMHLIKVEDAPKAVDPGIAAKAKIRQVLTMDDAFNPELRPIEPSSKLLEDLSSFITKGKDYTPQPSVGTINEQLKIILKNDPVFCEAPEPSGKLVSSLYRIMAPTEEEEAEDENMLAIMDSLKEEKLMDDRLEKKAPAMSIEQLLNAVGDSEKVLAALHKHKVDSQFLPADYKEKLEEMASGKK
jgi:magnesium-transporting ATPase (P-type)